MDLVGKVAVITGGTRGIGLAVAKDLIQNGASRVIISGRDVQEGGKALKVLKDLCDKDTKAIYVPMDVTSEEELKELFNYTATNMGGLDILVNSAAILNESSMWRRMVDTNVRALITSTELGIDLMKKFKRPGRGVIVNLSAMYAIKPLPQLPVFSGTKAAVRAASLAYSKMKDSNLRIITACMGPTNTSMLLNLSPDDIGEWTKGEQEDLLDMLKAKQKSQKTRESMSGINLNLVVKSGVPNWVKNSNILAIVQSIQHLLSDNAHDRIALFLKRTGYRVDGYITL
ncbi:15-hydroxyprostaglandin dehydrogenase [NAD(+)]-like [Melanaphis sacchari]|uniref:15-hydroxyprostaglandin dehydrogenase [NAD(+)]-like n=1 Tax=Melanaphis sacchari TaxID=742174 RepID=UPI000DC1376D|nr:15-hydroxyprostaglandin dehydrogenase [NAD(+)]-like [Melanaphis sacchari]